MTLKYQHTQKGSKLIYYISIFMVFECLAIEAFVYLVGTRSEDPLARNQLILAMVLIPLVPGVVLGWAFLLMSSLTVSVDPEYVRVRFGPGAWRKTIPLDRIVLCRPVKNDWINGWGIHYIGKKCWLYNIAGMEAVEITYKNGKRTRIGTDEPDKLAEAIQDAISQAPKAAV